MGPRTGRNSIRVTPEVATFGQAQGSQAGASFGLALLGCAGQGTVADHHHQHRIAGLQGLLYQAGAAQDFIVRVRSQDKSAWRALCAKRQSS